MVKNPEIATLSLDGEALCMNFVNTVHNRTETPPPEYLKNPLDLIAWAEKVGLLTEKAGKRLEKSVLDNPKKARQLFAEALALRELLFRIFSAVISNKKITAHDLSAFNAMLKDHLCHVIITPGRDGFIQSWDYPDDSLQQITAPVIRDAHELLLAERLHRVKECPNCGWLFLDTTRNGKRRWCSMKSCGSNIKALQWYYRQRER